MFRIISARRTPQRIDYSDIPDPSVLESFRKEDRRDASVKTLINEVLAEHLRRDA